MARQPKDRFPGGRLRNGVWELRFSLGPDPALKQPNGSPVYRYRSVSFKGTKTEARAERQRLLDEVRPTTVDQTDATFADLYTAWMKEATDLAAGTRYTHNIAAQKHVLPAIGNIKLRELTTQRLEQLYAHLHRPKSEGGAGLSPRTIRRHHALISTALRRACAWGWLDRNPAAFAKPPRIVGKPVLYVPTIEELIRALNEAAKSSLYAYTFVATAAWTGMRRGELCGLQWADINAATGMIHLRRNIVDVGGYAVEKLPKSGKPRMVEISPMLVKTLFDYQMAVDPVGPWLWSTDRGVTRASPDHLTAIWNEVKTAAGLPKNCRLHDIRHSYGSILMEAGGEGSLTATAALMGHADSTTTQKYYLTSGVSSRRLVVDQMDDLYEAARRLQLGP